MPDFTATSTLTKQLFQSWRLVVADAEARDQVLAFPTASLLTILEAAVESPHVTTLQATLLLGLDFVFFNRGDSVFPIMAADLVEEGDYITFRETYFKCKRVDSLVNRVQHFNAGRLPILHTCLHQYKALHAAHFVPASPSLFFWQLHAEGSPLLALIR